jgi:hypothetical protein
MRSGQEARGKIVSGEVSVSISAERNAGLTRPRNEQVSQPAVLEGSYHMRRCAGCCALYVDIRAESANFYAIQENAPFTFRKSSYPCGMDESIRPWRVGLHRLKQTQLNDFFNGRVMRFLL